MLETTTNERDNATGKRYLYPTRFAMVCNDCDEEEKYAVSTELAACFRPLKTTSWLNTVKTA
jgi:hypothetical protein